MLGKLPGAGIPGGSVPSQTGVTHTGDPARGHCPPISVQDAELRARGCVPACAEPGAPMRPGRTAYHEGCRACLVEATATERALGPLDIGRGTTLVAWLLASLQRYGEARR